MLLRGFLERVGEVSHFACDMNAFGLFYVYSLRGSSCFGRREREGRFRLRSTELCSEEDSTPRVVGFSGERRVAAPACSRRFAGQEV